MKQLFKLETDPDPSVLINQARQILNADYLKRCTDEYKKWSTNNPYANHRTGELLLRFPPFTGVSHPIGFASTIRPPSEKDVVNKALELFNLNKSKENPIVDSIVDQDIDPELTLNQPLSPVQEPVEEIPAPAPKNTDYVNKVFDIFKVIDKLATTEPVPPPAPAPEPTPPELVPIPIPPIEVIPEPISESILESAPTPEPTPPELVPIPTPPIEVIPEPISEPVSTPGPTPPPPIEVIPEPVPIPESKVIPQTDNPYVAKIEEIFKDVPKQPPQESFTSILRKTFFGAKTNK